MTVLTYKLRASIRRVVQGRGLTFRQLYSFVKLTRLHAALLNMVHWPNAQQFKYLKDLLLDMQYSFNIRR